MLSCKKATKIYLKSLDTKISIIERILLIFHINLCPDCKKFKQQILFLKKSVNKLAKIQQNNEEIVLNPKIKEEIRKQLVTQNLENTSILNEK